jgi:hypothetical protein
LKKKVNKREVKLRRQIEEKEGEEIKLQRIRKEAFRATCVIYIESLASMSPPRFQKSNESSRKERNI